MLRTVNGVGGKDGELTADKGMDVVVSMADGMVMWR